MLKISFIAAFLILTVIAKADALFTNTQKIASEMTSHGQAYSNLKELTKIGPRLSGTQQAEKAVQWGKKKMESYGFDKVWLQPVQVPSWKRGKIEKCTLLDAAKSQLLKVTALGRSVATPPGGVTAQVVEVKTLAEVEQLGSAVKGKIVFYNRAMDPAQSETFSAYSDAIDQRIGGASIAAKHGAVAMVMRSLSSLQDDDHPHTGTLHYDEKLPKIAAGAISTHGANILSARLKDNPQLKLRLELETEEGAMLPSFNVIGQITGQDLPNEYIVVGGHLDSWDLGTGAHDDGAGVVQSIEVLRSLRALKIQPKRSIRAVLFMAEESGAYGGKEYAKQVKSLNETHIAAIESDSGGFYPRGMHVDADAKILSYLQGWKHHFTSLGADKIEKGYGGTDIDFLEPLGTIVFGLNPDPKLYFNYHHSALDTIDKVVPKDLHAGAATMAIMAYLLSENGIAK